jgi:hypothetical protein
MDIRIEVETFTPAAARTIVAACNLEGYGHRERIERYKQLMLDGEWSLFYNGTASRFINDPLIFLPGGRLFEGKHRMVALSEISDDDSRELPFWVLRDFTALEEFKRWMDDYKAGRLPTSSFKQTLPPHPRLRAHGSEQPE